MGACGRTGPGPSCTQTSRHHARLRNGNARVHTPQLGTQPGQLHRDGWTGDAVLQQAPMGAAWEVEKHGQGRSVCGEGEGQEHHRRFCMDMEHKKCIVEFLKWPILNVQDLTWYAGP